MAAPPPAAPPPPRGAVVLLDVHDLPPPEPFERATFALDVLAAGEALHFFHRREPRLLYPLLEARGFEQVTRVVSDSEVHVLIWRRGDSLAEAAAAATLASLPAAR